MTTSLPITFMTPINSGTVQVNADPCGRPVGWCACTLRRVSWAEASRIAFDTLLAAEAKRDALAEREAERYRGDYDF